MRRTRPETTLIIYYYRLYGPAPRSERRVVEADPTGRLPPDGSDENTRRTTSAADAVKPYDNTLSLALWTGRGDVVTCCKRDDSIRVPSAERTQHTSGVVVAVVVVAVCGRSSARAHGVVPARCCRTTMYGVHNTPCVYGVRTRRACKAITIIPRVLWTHASWGFIADWFVCERVAKKKKKQKSSASGRIKKWNRNERRNDKRSGVSTSETGDENVTIMMIFCYVRVTRSRKTTAAAGRVPTTRVGSATASAESVSSDPETNTFCRILNLYCLPSSSCVRALAGTVRAGYCRFIFFLLLLGIIMYYYYFWFSTFLVTSRAFSDDATSRRHC